MKLLSSTQSLLLMKDQKIGVITNYSTEEFLKRDFITKKMNFGEYVEVVDKENIDVVFIENDIYEVDHEWYGLDTKSIISHIEKLNVNIVIIDNTENREYSDEFPYLIMDNNSTEIVFNKNILKMPLLVNEKLLNPVKVRKNLDLLALRGNAFNEEFKTLHKTVKLKREIINFNEIKRSTIKKIVSKLKETRVIYIPYNENIDFRLLNYIEKASVLQNTVMIIDPEYPYNMKYAIKPSNQESCMHTIQTFTNDGLYRDKKNISDSRKVFLENTLMQYESLDMVLNGDVNKKNIEISVITSTKRKWTLPDYIERLNKQTYVTLQVILLTHGFELSLSEEKTLKDMANFELHIISEEKTTVFGTCLNKCIDLAKYKYFTKMDDDDYYYPNYLIDSWIGKKYSDADIVGKYSQFVYLESSGMTIQRFSHLQQRYSKYVAGATIFCETDFVKEFKFSEKSKAVDSDIIRRVLEKDGIIYCTHPYEFCIFRADNKEEHTWQIPDITLLKSADVLFYGNPNDTLSVE